jgi:protein-S-isoprenylcysteine O-methyltransferase Ste14
MLMLFYIILLNALAACFLIMEMALVARDRRRGAGKPGRDRGTRFINFAGVTLGLTGAGLLAGFTNARLQIGNTAIIYWIGIAVMVAGLAFRIWAIAVLGKSFRTTVETFKGQEVVKEGPYRLLRHPSYTGILIICLGYGLAVQNWLSLFPALLLPLAALVYRIHVEEELLVESLGQAYVDYKKHTKRLIPWVW